VMRDGRISESHAFAPSVKIGDDDTVVDLARRIARDCYPAVYDDLKWE
jgi:hypothetical protein